MKVLIDVKDQKQNEAARDYLRAVMETLDLDATKLARRAKLSPSTLTGFMSPSPRVKTIRQATLDAVARSTGIPLPAALQVGEAIAQPVSAAAFPHDVPIHGLVGAPIAGCYYWNQTALDFAPRPPGVARAARVFAFRMPDDSMLGWRRVGEFVFVDPTRPVAEGDHALVEIGNQPTPNDPSVYVIRRVLRRRPDKVVLGNWGMEPGEQTYRRSEVLAFHKVVEWQELVFG